MFFALNIFGGNAPYLPAFRWSFGGFPLLREAGVECFFLPKAKKHSHSRESGNLPVLLIVLGMRCRKTVRDSGRFPLSREWKGGREWKGRGMEMRGGEVIRRWGYLPMGAFADKRKNVFLPKAKKTFPFPRKRESPCPSNCFGNAMPEDS